MEEERLKDRERVALEILENKELKEINELKFQEAQAKEEMRRYEERIKEL